MKEYRLEIKVKNNVVLKRIDELGYDTVPAFCRAHKLSYVIVNDIIKFKLPFYTKFGRVSESLVRVGEALQMLPEDMYPPERREKPLPKNHYIIETDKADLMQISTSLRLDALPVDDRKMLEDFAPTIKRVMLTLTPKEQRVLDRRYGITSGTPETCEEIGKDMNLSGYRINQIEHKAIRKMKHPQRSVKLREYLDFIQEVKAR
jgi:hypothetical protein